MTKVIINDSFGGFSFSKQAVVWLRERGYQPAFGETLPGEKWPDTGKVRDGYEFNSYLRLNDAQRADALPVQCVEALGKKANGACAELKVVEVPDDAEWHIHEYDGLEHVAENHRTWN